jgi:hypothetical protein
MPERSKRWASPKALAIPLIVLAVPLAAIAALISAVFGLKEKRSASEVATYLRNFLNDESDSWDWDDFTSVEIADPKLEDIRRRAAALDLPITGEGTAELGRLLAEAESLASG